MNKFTLFKLGLIASLDNLVKQSSLKTTNPRTEEQHILKNIYKLRGKSRM